MKTDSRLFLTKVILDKEKTKGFSNYPFNIELIKNFKELNFTSPVTFLVGENGVGKSTFIEALAVALDLNPEGGTQNFMFSTRDTHSNLHEFIEVNPFQKLCKTKFFLRAESFYNFASELEKIQVGGYGKNSLHACSHGESFMQLIQNRFTENGLYILDEPEAALSPQRQMSLLCLIDDLVKQGSQFIIATHSPILISYRDGEILNLDNNFEKIKYKDTNIYNLYKMYIDDSDGVQHQLFD